jgi:FMN phosphatase YigB (HAD superfamily)
MRVAIVHYHLEPGGVTRVIETTSEILTAAGTPHVILCGSSSAPRSSRQRTLPGLHYLPHPGKLTAVQLLESLRAAAIDALGAPPEIWHFHNHSLGKNRLIPQAVDLLAEAGERLLLHLHDLAEDGRPLNYPLIADCHTLYPISPRIHYAFLNPRDLQTFIDAGLPPGNASLLPNPVPVPPSRPAIPAAESPLLLAPVRGIRRKNLGELTLLAALAPPGTRVAVSRAPLNPQALPVHQTWEKFAGNHRIPIGFNVVDRYTPAPGAGSDFQSWIDHATHFVSTSVAEGFGLPFLEATAHEKPLIGRNLPHITATHAATGIRCGRLYDRILIPVDWLDLTIVRSHLTTTLERNFRYYQRQLSPADVEATLEILVRENHLDFGNLPEALQQEVIERSFEPIYRDTPLVVTDETRQPLTEWLAETLARRDATATPSQLAAYSPEAYRQKLSAIYQILSTAPAEPIRHLPPRRILSSCLTPERFHFLLSALPPPPVRPKFRAVVFDIYGTLLAAPSGAVRPDPAADPLLREILESFGHVPPESPSSALHAAVLHHHAATGVPYPEIDLRILWREILSIDPGTDVAPLVEALEAAWHPTRPMPGAESAIQKLARLGLSLGLLSNAQCNTLPSLGPIADLFAPELTLLSYQHGIAKPAPELFKMLADRLSGRKISPAETLYIGNDPIADILPAAEAGFRTALFTGHPDSLRPGECSPDHVIEKWSELGALITR